MKSKANPFIEFLPAAARSTSPWKNGGGETTEIAIEPPGATLTDNNFLWRLSAATIEQAGPFSSFPNYDRLLTLIAGKECVLRINKGEEFAGLRLGEVFPFSGDAKVQCELPSGPCQDLGLLFQKKKVDAEMHVFALKNKPRSFALQTKAAIFFLISGELQVSVYPGEHIHSLQKHDALRLNIDDQVSEYIISLEEKQPQTLVAAIELQW